jgi:hypothetical protein
MNTRSSTFFRVESIMTKQPKDTSKPVDQPDKQKSETVQLTADDLRAISGGQAQASTPGPLKTQPDVKVNTNK